jgi:hypothetical protein
MTSLTFTSRFNKSPAFTINALILNKLMGRLPHTNLPQQQWTHLNDVPLADPNFHHPSPVDILLGADVFWDLLTDGKKTSITPGLVGINSALGWLVAGKTDLTAPRVRVHFTDSQELDSSLQRFWELEAVPEVRLQLSEEIVCEQHSRKSSS